MFCLALKRHDNVKRTIETLAKNGVIRLPQIEVSERINNLGFNVQYEHYVFEGEQGKLPLVTLKLQRWLFLLAQQVRALTTPDKSSDVMVKPCSALSCYPSSASHAHINESLSVSEPEKCRYRWRPLSGGFSVRQARFLKGLRNAFNK